MGKQEQGLHEAVFQCITRCDIDVRRELYQGIVLSGGTSMFEGLGERLQAEVSALAPPTVRIRVFAPPERRFSDWIGGTIVASLSALNPRWITRSAYEKHGSAPRERLVTPRLRCI